VLGEEAGEHGEPGASSRAARGNTLTHRQRHAGEAQREAEPLQRPDRLTQEGEPEQRDHDRHGADDERDQPLKRLWDLDDEIDELGRVDIVDLALEALMAACRRPIRSVRLSMEGLNRARAIIAADPAKRHSLDTLEKVAKLDRWTLARQFRAAFGTSPSRYRTMRQVNIVRRLIHSGVPLVEASLRAGFADQSHMTRQFKKPFGLAPGHWATAAGRA
jgi:AraC-like DNA-binding protein